MKPIVCLVQRADGRAPPKPSSQQAQEPSDLTDTGAGNSIRVLDHDYIKKNFKLPQRPLYLDPNHRPLISFPMTQENVTNFNLARKYKINQQILDGAMDPMEAIIAPNVLPYGNAQSYPEQQKGSEATEETIYILQLPDWEYHCPIHNKMIKTPRFIWHSTKNNEKGDAKGTGAKHGGGPMKKPKPWLLSRHTDFDLMSQW